MTPQASVGWIPIGSGVLPPDFAPVLLWGQWADDMEETWHEGFYEASTGKFYATRQVAKPMLKVTHWRWGPEQPK